MPGREFCAVKGAELARSDAETIARRQDELLRRHVEYAYTRSAFYRRTFDGAGVTPADIRTSADLVRLPFTAKRDLEECHADFLALGEGAMVDLCLTSGTTGKAVAMLQSAQDLKRLAYNEEISFRGAGFTADDRVLVVAAVDRCFMAGLAYFLGLTALGATVLRGGSSNIPLLMELVKNCAPSGIVGVPSLLLALGERLQQGGLDPARLGVRKIVCIGEPVRRQDFSLSALGERVAAIWGAQIFGTYASTEMATSFTDCPAGLGGHLHPDLMVVEVVDEEGRAVPPGEFGEVVATPLGVTGMPLLRFRTGDIAKLHTEPCVCGRNTHRLGPVLGRKAQMLKYRGTTVYPPAIFSVLQEIEGIRGYYIEAHSEFELSDRIRVVVGAQDSTLSAAYVADRISATIRVKPEVVVASPEEVQKKTVQDVKQKPVTFFDYRV
ncbi:AMP-binding protein [Geomonas sp. RF6]|uniref:phenylacetate--CoA ligase family protein n=1 Tax=Geomonas sp. RF6 TaxID=2897342 RepID=UPI001E4FAD0B|nr:AMP-binding protein [Geomonas sp. RF6]UFS69360.1 AMP-binding protein [Geomonas sp. RF6]